MVKSLLFGVVMHGLHAMMASHHPGNALQADTMDSGDGFPGPKMSAIVRNRRNVAGIHCRDHNDLLLEILDHRELHHPVLRGFSRLYGVGQEIPEKRCGAGRIQKGGAAVADVALKGDVFGLTLLRVPKQQKIQDGIAAKTVVRVVVSLAM